MPYDNEISERFLIVFQFYKGLECSCSLLRLLKVFCDSPGQNGYIGSCRTGFKSAATRRIGFGRLLFVGFRCYPLFSFDIRWPDLPNSARFSQSESVRSYLRICSLPMWSRVIWCQEMVGFCGFTWHRILW